MRLLVSFLVFTLTALANPPVEHLNLSDSEGLSGFDPVSYRGEVPVKGKEEWTFEYNGALYRFANKANKEIFKVNPSKYLPAYGGWCAYAMLDGDKVEVDPMSYKLIDGKLYLFYNGFWGDTLKRWNKKLAKSSEASLVSKADKHWMELIKAP